MKVLFLLSRIEKNGVTIHTLDLAKGLVEQGHELIIISGGITDTSNDYLVKLLNDFKKIGVQLKIFKTPKGRTLKKSWTSFRSIIQILGWIRSIQADVIHCQSPYMTFLPWLLRKKYITTVHNVTLIKNIKYKNPTKIIAISQESKAFAIKELGAHPNNVSVVYHGIPERFAKPTSIENLEELIIVNTIPKNKIIIGSVGRITREKGLDVLINAIDKELPKHLIPKLHVIFLGDFWKASDEDWITKTIESSGLSNQITIIPFQDPKPFYTIFDIFVLPSRSEAFGLVSVEAMMSGCCAVRTNTNGALDQIHHGEDGFIFENGNAKELALILEKIIENPQLKLDIALKGKAKALENFTIESMTAKTLEVYQNVMSI